jgi:inositol hexakisphosphate/diphosphoinositol-pentakisphosphate kinase
MYGHFSGINRKVQLKYLKPKDIEPFSEDESAVPELLLILKWGITYTSLRNIKFRWRIDNCRSFAS